MTILVALTCEGSAVVASDCRRRLHGVDSDDFPKTFGCRTEHKQIIGGISGQLLDGERPMPQVLEELCNSATTLEELAERCLGVLWRKVPKENGLDVLVVGSRDLGVLGRPEIRWVRFEPGEGNGPRASADGTVTTPSQAWAIAGSGDCVEVRQHLSPPWDRENVVEVARRMVEAGIAASAARDRSCGGIPSVQSLRFG
jgi:hypothetical protein